MKIVLFKKEPLPGKKTLLEAKKETATKYNEQLVSIESRVIKCELIGLKEQAELAKITLKELSGKIRHECPLGPATFYPAINEEEMRIWSKWLPASYVSEPSKIQERKIESYKFDTIPEGVLNEWQLAKSLDLFEEFEIRTPERQIQDPILIGWNNKIPYLIARWGESLIPFEEIKKSIFKDEDSEKFTENLSVAVGLLIFASICIPVWKELPFANNNFGDILIRSLLTIMLSGIISVCGSILGIPLSFLLYPIKCSLFKNGKF